MTSCATSTANPYSRAIEESRCEASTGIVEEVRLAEDVQHQPLPNNTKRHWKPLLSMNSESKWDDGGIRRRLVITNTTPGNQTGMKERCCCSPAYRFVCTTPADDLARSIHCD